MFKVITHSDRMKLVALVNNPGYQVLLDLMEMEREKQVTELLRVDPANSAAVIAAHNTARAFGVFFERMQKVVNFEINEALEQIEASKTKSEDVVAIPGLSDPVHIGE